MALVVTVTETFSATKVILTDTTGDYVAVTNPTGYGNTASNEFVDFGHYAIIRKKNVNSVADAVLTLDSYNPVTATEFTADRAVDGWYEGKKLTIPIWLVGTAYTSGTAATASIVDYLGTPYRSIQSGTGHLPSDAAWWTAVTDLTTIEANPTITVTTINRVTPYNADVYWSKVIAANSQKGLCGLCEDDRQKERLDKIYLHIQCVLVADQLGSDTAGEWNSLTLQTLGAK